MTPEETFHQLLDRLLAKDLNGMADLWAEDGTAEFPYAMADAPRRLEGREAIRAHLLTLVKVTDPRETPEIIVHRTDTPDTIIAEFSARGHTVRTGAPYELSYVVVLTVRDGRIVNYRDYWNPVATASAAGRLPEFLDAVRTR